jgi:hypothetical protein
MATQRYLRKIYNYRGMNRYMSVLLPRELGEDIGEYVYVERTEDGILIRPVSLIPKWYRMMVINVNDVD